MIVDHIVNIFYRDDSLTVKIYFDP